MEEGRDLHSDIVKLYRSMNMKRIIYLEKEEGTGPIYYVYLPYYFFTFLLMVFSIQDYAGLQFEKYACVNTPRVEVVIKSFNKMAIFKQ